MTKRLTMTLMMVLCLAVVAHGAMIIIRGPVGIDGGGAAFCGGSELLCTDFESSYNADCSTCTPAWTESNVVTCAATDQKIGSYSMKVTDDGTNSYATSEVFAEQTTIFLKYSFFSDNVTNQWFCFLLDGFTAAVQITVDATDHLKVTGHGGSDTEASTLSDSTWYTVKVKYVKGTGLDGTIHVWWSAGENVTLSTDTGVADLSITSGTGTYSPDRLRAYGITAGTSVWYDNVVAKGSDPDA